MTVLDQLKKLSAAEEFFHLLDVPFDPAVVNVARLHILKRMGQYLRTNQLDGVDDAGARSLCRAHLERAYSDFVASSPLQQRVFKVLQDAVAPPPAPPLVQLGSLSAPAPEKQS
jgi:nitrogenase-stabilizing/protective protein